MIALARVLLPVAALATVLALIGFARAGDRLPRFARLCFYIQCACVEIAAAVLLNSILTHRFNLDYVYSHSSTNLPLVYLVSTFWSGQEGTFLMWACYSSLLGCALLPRLREWEGSVMTFFCGVHLAVLGLLLARSPFLPLDHSHFQAADLNLIGKLFAGIPPEGEGLNKLLQNPWMAIHPPILFLGFSSLAVPFCFACAGLVRRDHDGWQWRARGWTLFSWSILGLGLILGGYWAYETLGWGGYWGWDPVENSSLAPWLFAGALFHALILAKVTKGGHRRLTYLLAALAFGSVSYGSYLNRSGVLSDFSVHSFAAVSATFNRALLAFALLPPLLYAALLVRRWPGEPEAGVTLEAEEFGRKRMLGWAVTLLLASAIVVLIGNSWPLVSAVLAKTPVLKSLVAKRSSLQPQFYNWLHTPWALVLCALLSIVMLSDWDRVRREKLLAGLTWPLAITIATSGLIAARLLVFFRHYAATPDWLRPSARPYVLVWALLLALSVLSSCVNLSLVWGKLRERAWLKLGHHLSHSGFCLLVGGVVISSVFDVKTMLPLAVGSSKEFGGYTLAYHGLVPEGTEDARMDLTVTSGGVTRKIQPLLRPGQDGPVRNPGILKLWTHDLYLEPGEIREAEGLENVLIEKGATVKNGPLELTFVALNVPDHRGMNEKNFKVGAQLRVKFKGQSVDVEPALQIKDGQLVPGPVLLPDGRYVQFVGLPLKDGSQARQADLVLSKTAETGEVAVVQASLKPGMSLVWLGCWLMILGGLVAALKRSREAVARRG